MPDVSADNLGLRERKKRRTREAVRSAAFRLFERNGYANTTVEQIAQASDVSPRTFFRYFPNKAALLIPDHLMEPVVDLFLAAPAELSPFAAYRYALQRVFSGIAGHEWSDEISRQQLLYTLPEAAGALYNEYIHVITVITGALAQRLDRPVDDPQLRIAAGAMTGVMMAALHDTPMSPELLFDGLDFLDAGLPLRAAGTETRHVESTGTILR
ncbi:TetR family transcriptional regulator [Mycolicibacterium duvalii]|uniref:TetR family transcriptional regulator n=1 Tax=Mycolicibacterium duvalii TaxID=39688 RepID=A0A7I7K6N1_9MYCO|nr:TetR family transcriptional regulator [Mycolicibacterium duvalii]MCV7368933.1 TetR family transcriptional regulator [Mycolicibacterium duvalii]PEG44420.1 TetR family transcriptional regulator [Mycolicibacterium duvalii]BBX19169.1 TetR family transcriptional regulator [Mycolicibacterium duvalii]